MGKFNFLILFLAIFCLATPSQAQNDADSLLALANTLIYKDPTKAIELAKIAYGKPASTRTKVNALLTISTAYSSKREYEKSSEYILEIKKLLPNVKNPIVKINILNRIAAHYQELQIYDKTMEFLDEALTLIEKYPQQDSVQTFLGYNSILRGFIYREQMNCDIALKYFDNAIVAYNKTLAREPLMNANVSICYYNKGNCLLTLNKIEQAKESYQMAIGHAKQENAKSLIAFAEKGLAEAETIKGNYKESLAFLNDALSISREVGDLILNRGIHEGMANDYLALNDWENYVLHHNTYLALQNETKISERKSINQSLVNLTEDKQKEIDKIKKRLGPIQIGSIFIVLLALILLIRSVVDWEKKLKKLEKNLKS